MTAQGGDLLAWLETAIIDRETAARAASEGPWEETGIGEYGWTVSAPNGALFETDDSDQGRADAHYIALNDPESVLRRCAADRKLLASLKAVMEGDYIDDGEPVLAEHALAILAEGYGWTEGER
ncbi:hypothetical protein SUDANB145_07303 (plasmid) [Streptomyces sp. enrichment culture]|uniref:DUF6221 family protein n=1 Tax=Streptomyces sp. enrichment culture TaxID=1795815 RepID=UPI003F547AA7